MSPMPYCIGRVGFFAVDWVHSTWLQQKDFFEHLLPKSCLCLELANTVLTQVPYLLPPCCLKQLVDSPNSKVSLHVFRTMYKVQVSLHWSDVLCSVQEEPRMRGGINSSKLTAGFF